MSVCSTVLLGQAVANSFVLISPLTDACSCQCLDTGKAETGPLGSSSKSESVWHNIYSPFPFPGRSWKLGIFSWFHHGMLGVGATVSKCHKFFHVPRPLVSIICTFYLSIHTFRSSSAHEQKDRSHIVILLGVILLTWCTTNIQHSDILTFSLEKCLRFSKETS